MSVCVCARALCVCVYVCGVGVACSAMSAAFNYGWKMSRMSVGLVSFPRRGKDKKTFKTSWFLVVLCNTTHPRDPPHPPSLPPLCERTHKHTSYSASLKCIPLFLKCSRMSVVLLSKWTSAHLLKQCGAPPRPRPPGTPSPPHSPHASSARAPLKRTTIIIKNIKCQTLTTHAWKGKLLPKRDKAGRSASCRRP